MHERRFYFFAQDFVAFVVPTKRETEETLEPRPRRDPDFADAPRAIQLLTRLRARSRRCVTAEYRLIWYAQIFASQATWMDQVARGWLLYELTNSTLQLGLVRGVQAIPILLLSPLAGSIADRYSRKNQVLVAQIVDGVLFAIVAALIFAGRIEPWHVYVTAFGMSVVQAFQQPSRAAMIGDAVPVSHLTNAIGLNSIIFNVSRSAGPAIAGLLIAVVGTGGAYTRPSGLLLSSDHLDNSVELRPQRFERARRANLAMTNRSRKSIIEGWKFSWRNEAVRASLLIVAFSSIFIIPFMTLLPVFARDILHVGATGQGLAAQRHGHRRAVQLGADRLFRRSSTAG